MTAGAILDYLQADQLISRPCKAAIAIVARIGAKPSPDTDDGTTGMNTGSGGATHDSIKPGTSPHHIVSQDSTPGLNPMLPGQPTAAMAGTVAQGSFYPLKFPPSPNPHGPATTDLPMPTPVHLPVKMPQAAGAAALQSNGPHMNANVVQPEARASSKSGQNGPLPGGAALPTGFSLPAATAPTTTYMEGSSQGRPPDPPTAGWPQPAAGPHVPLAGPQVSPAAAVPAFYPPAYYLGPHGQQAFSQPSMGVYHGAGVPWYPYYPPGAVMPVVPPQMGHPTFSGAPADVNGHIGPSFLGGHPGVDTGAFPAFSPPGPGFVQSQPGLQHPGGYMLHPMGNEGHYIDPALYGVHTHGRDGRQRRHGAQDRRQMRDGSSDRSRSRTAQHAARAGSSSSSSQPEERSPAAQLLLNQLRMAAGTQVPLPALKAHLMAVCKDQNGSKVIQQQMDDLPLAEVDTLFAELTPAQQRELVEDQFGNYVVQKFLDLASPQPRQQMLAVLRGNMLSLSRNQFGCRVVQKALEVVPEEERKELVTELNGHVFTCYEDANGNHVIQKCIERCKPSDDIMFIMESVRDNIQRVSRHQFGCRVVQRLLEHCTLPDVKQQVIQQLIEEVPDLAQNEYGNYVVQHLVTENTAYRDGSARSHVIQQLTPHLLPFARSKFSSNVLEKCLKHGEREQVDGMVNMVLQADEAELDKVCRDMYGNYVIQKMLQVANKADQNQLVQRLHPKVADLRRGTYSKQLAGKIADAYKELLPQHTLHTGSSSPSNPTPLQGAQVPFYQAQGSLPTASRVKQEGSEAQAAVTPVPAGTMEQQAAAELSQLTLQ